MIATILYCHSRNAVKQWQSYGACSWQKASTVPLHIQRSSCIRCWLSPVLRTTLPHKLDVASSSKHNLWSTRSRATAETIRMLLTHLPDLWGWGAGHQGVLSEVCCSCVSKPVIPSPFTGPSQWSTATQTAGTASHLWESWKWMSRNRIHTSLRVMVIWK